MQTDENENRDAAETGAATFEEWLALTAASKGIEREALLDQLVSSYWTLTEIVGLVGGSGRYVDDATPDESSVTSGEPEFELPVGVATNDELAELRETVQAIDERLAALERSVRDDSAANVPAETFREFAAETSTATARNAARQDSLHGFISEEFANLRSILEYLIDTTNDFDGRADGIETAIAELRHHVANDEALVDLKQRASRMGVKTADCEHCGVTLQLSLLATPFCPKCENKFDGLERRDSGLLSFGSNTLVVTSGGEGSHGGRLTWDELAASERRDDAMRQGKSGTGSRTGEPFLWLSTEQLDDPEN